jgi:hypothetical protein
MIRPPIRYREALSPEELAFLRKKEQRERRQFFRVIRVLLLLCFFCPFVLAWYRAIEDVPEPFSYGFYFLGVLFLMCFSGCAVWIVYNSNLRKLQSDIAGLTKTVEQTRIVRKQHMEINNTYHFYLDSPVKLSIEVSEADFHRLQPGDEVNIEYSPRAHTYFGYF